MKFVRFDYAVFLLFAVYALCSLIIPLVLVEVGRDLDFDLTAGGMSAGGILQLGRSLPMVGSMLVCSMLDCHLFNLGPTMFYSLALAFAEHSIKFKK